MIIVKSNREIELMKQAGKIVALVFEKIKPLIVPGVTTKHIADMAEKVITENGAIPTFKGYGGFSGAICISVNEVLVHGIPSNYKLKEGDIVSCDVGATYQGYIGDACRTFLCGKVSDAAQELVRVTEECFFKAMELAKPGVHLSDLSHAIQTHAESHGFSVARDFTGHGVGRNLHEDPVIPNYGIPGHGPILKEGMCLAIEPIILQGRKETVTLSDGWTTKTIDGKLAAHYENSIVITKTGYEILTKL